VERPKPDVKEMKTMIMVVVVAVVVVAVVVVVRTLVAVSCRLHRSN
jgi:hypothetical protein